MGAPSKLSLGGDFQAGFSSHGQMVISRILFPSSLLLRCYGYATGSPIQFLPDFL